MSTKGDCVDTDSRARAQIWGMAERGGGRQRGGEASRESRSRRMRVGRDWKGEGRALRKGTPGTVLLAEGDVTMVDQLPSPPFG